MVVGGVSGARGPGEGRWSIDCPGNLEAERTAGVTVARVVKRAAEAAGLDPESDSRGTRCGSCSWPPPDGVGAPNRSIANQTGHRSMLVLRGYIRRADVFEGNAAVAVAVAVAASRSVIV